MAINYSLYPKYSRPGDKKSKKKLYAAAQCLGVCTTKQLMKLASKRSKSCDEPLVGAVLDTVAKCVKEMLLQGMRVNMGDLGTLYCVINGTGADTPEDFTVAGNIRGLTVRWEPSKYFENLHREAKYKRVPRRSTQRRGRRKNNQELQAKLDASNKKPEAEE
ncbi:MAG: hypothetical protein LUC86_07920 [Prevotellaceae bacterium]|nr:hypothetical protein [Prevotellaceae bacterium]